MPVERKTGPKSWARFGALIEPLPGRDVEEIVALLRESGVEDFNVLGDGFVSASIDSHLANRLGEISHVTQKVEKRPRGPSARRLAR